MKERYEQTRQIKTFKKKIKEECSRNKTKGRGKNSTAVKEREKRNISHTVLLLPSLYVNSAMVALINIRISTSTCRPSFLWPFTWMQ